MAKKDAPVETNVEPSAEPAVTTKKNSNKTLWIVLGTIVVLFVVIPGILLTVGGLFIKDKLNDEKSGEKLAESLVERATGGKVDVDSDKDGNFSVKSEDGDSSIGFGSDQKLPDDFPKDKIPYLNEKSVTFVIASDNEDGHSWSVTTTVDKSFDEAVAYFEDRLKSPEFSDTSNFGFGESKTFYGKKENLTVTVSISKSEDSDTSVSYIVSDETVHTH